LSTKSPFQKPKASLPDMAWYNRQSKETYNTFCISLITKININTKAISNNYAKAWYIFL
jgi:hypothetical protein